MNENNSDRIERTVTLRAPREEVWKALTDTTEFGEWFGVLLSGEFVPGGYLCGPITNGGDESDEIVEVEFTVERMETDNLLSWRWHPNAIKPGVDYSNEPTTLVTFRLEDAEEGTNLTVIETGFEKLPEERREEAYRANDEGWSMQMKNIEQHVGVAV